MRPSLKPHLGANKGNKLVTPIRCNLLDFLPLAVCTGDPDRHHVGWGLGNNVGQAAIDTCVELYFLAAIPEANFGVSQRIAIPIQKLECYFANCILLQRNALTN